MGPDVGPVSERAWGHTHDSPHPRWRDFSDREIETPTRTIIIKAATQIGEWLLEDVGSDQGRWQQLIKRFADLAPEARETFLRKLNVLAETNVDDDFRAELQRSLRQLIHHHRGFPETNWAMPEEQLAELEAAYNALTPKDAIKKIAWMSSPTTSRAFVPPPGTTTKLKNRRVINCDVTQSKR